MRIVCVYLKYLFTYLDATNRVQLKIVVFWLLFLKYEKKAINELICFNIFIPGWNGLSQENLFLCIYASVCV